MQRNSNLRSILPLIIVCLTLMMSSCYNRRNSRQLRLQDTAAWTDSVPHADTLTAAQADSIAFVRKHHYSVNFNFVVTADSLIIISQPPEETVSNMQTDSLSIPKDQPIVVADFRIMPNDSIDSVWVQVANPQSGFGWIHESRLLQQVVPDDPISLFISTFSNIHLLLFLIIITFFAVGYLIRKMVRQNAWIVHFRDIDSFYPTLLALLVATSATFYASIQLFAPNAWQEFYYHPSLNPFSQPPLLAIFLISVWAMLVVAIAALDDTRKQLHANDAMLYLGGLAGVCAICYIVFSISTLYYVGYALLIAYYIFAIRKYFRHSRGIYYCGNCGAKLHRKGRCPVCGTMNE